MVDDLVNGSKRPRSVIDRRRDPALAEGGGAVVPAGGSGAAKRDRSVLDDGVDLGRVRLARGEADPAVRVLVDERLADLHVAEGRLPGRLDPTAVEIEGEAIAGADGSECGLDV